MKEYILTSAPSTVNWNYTYKCNLNCLHCYSRTRTDIIDLSLEDKIKVANNLIDSKVFLVNLGGGEPIFIPDCYEIINLLTNNNIYVTLSTNGSAITTETLKKLKDVNINALCISLDNIEPEKHNKIRGLESSFDDAINAIKLAVKNNIDVIISTVITTQNIEVLDKIVEFTIALGCTGISLRKMKMQGNALENQTLQLNEKQVKFLYELIPSLKEKYSNFLIDFGYGSKIIEGIDNGCTCGKTSLGIMPNGNMIPCVYNENLIIGNAVSTPIDEVWTNSNELNYLRENFECLGLMLKK